MPELPEVETIKRDLAKRIVGQRIHEVIVKDPMVVRSDTDEFSKNLVGAKIVDVARRGKAIIIKLDNGKFLIIQLVMTGQLVYHNELSHDRVIFKFFSGECLIYNDQRRFGRLNVIEDLNQLDFFRTLGPEPLEPDFDFKLFFQNLKKRKMNIKTLLLNQNLIAGIGNIYASEILFRAKINPRQLACRLKEEDIRRLYKSTVAVLKKAIRFRGSSFRNYRDANGQKGSFLDKLQVYGRENQECSFCKTQVMRIVQNGRSTFFCRRCQS